MKVLNESYNHLDNVEKLCLILSKGHARVESGFSINSETVENSLKESSMVSQRIVSEGIGKAGGFMKVNIFNEKIDSPNLSSVTEREPGEPKRLNDEINTLKGAKKSCT